MSRSWLSLVTVSSSSYSVHSEYTLCPPATSTLVERAFSQSELFVRLHRARISDNLLCHFMLAGCNRLNVTHCVTVMYLDTRVLANVAKSQQKNLLGSNTAKHATKTSIVCCLRGVVTTGGTERIN